MEISRLSELLTSEDKNALVSAITFTVPDTKHKNIAAYLKQYDPEQHEIVQDPCRKRPDKIINGTTISYSKLPIPYQQLIVNRRAAFLAANPIQLGCTPSNDLEKGLLACIRKVWDDNKLDYDTKTLAKLMMSETEAAEIWYTETTDQEYWQGTIMQGCTYALRMRILANSLGDRLYPVFNTKGDMIAFGRSYYLVKDNNEQEEHFDIYTANKIYQGIHQNGTWEFTEAANAAGKISVIYYTQEAPEWGNVQRLIDRKETLISNHGDANDRMGNPMLKSKGEITGLETDLGQVKVLKMEGADADVDVLSWNNAPASVELEMKNLRSFILDFTDTPDISLEQMKSLGTYSGIALKMLFLGAHMGAANKEEIFGKCIQRRINYLKAVLIKLTPSLAPAKNLSIKPLFNLFLPKDDAAEIDMLVTATQGGIMSKETAVRKNPLIEDVEAEIKKLNKENENTPDKIDKEMNSY